MKDNLLTHGRTFVGRVISDKMHKTVTVEWDRRKFVPKYERFAKRRTRVKAHNPDKINAKQGQIVKIMETRPISKTKNFIVIEILGEHEEVKGVDMTLKEKKPKKKENSESKNNEDKNESN